MPRTVRASVGEVCFHGLRRGNARQAFFYQIEAALRLGLELIALPRGRPRTDLKKWHAPFSLSFLHSSLATSWGCQMTKRSPILDPRFPMVYSWAIPAESRYKTCPPPLLDEQNRRAGIKKSENKA